MLIGLCGAICSGKQTIADYLVQHHGFTQLHLQQELAIGRSLGNLDILQNSRSEEESLPAKIDGTGPHSHNEHTFTFNTADFLLDFVTKSWQSLWVTTDIHSEGILDKLDRRPFFILVSVDAPIYVRWKRFQERQRLQRSFSPSHESISPGSPGIRSHNSLSLEDFVQESDEHLYNSKNGLLPLISRAAIKLLNTSS
ncbi:deoxycytidylate deaminase, partial [Diplocarpon rosae]